MPGIFRPSHLLPSAYNPFVPDSEDSSEFESFSSDNKVASAEAAESARDEDRADSPSRSEGTCRITRRVLAQLRESEVAPHKLLTTCMLLVDFNQGLPLSIH